MNSLYRTVPNMTYQNNYTNDYSEYECSAIGLYIINISPTLLTKDLIKVLSKYGPITNAAIIGGLNVNHIYAYVDFADCGYAKSCYDSLINNEQDMAIIGVGSEKRYTTKLKLKWKRTEDDHEISAIVARRPNKARYNYSNSSYVPNGSMVMTEPMMPTKDGEEIEQTTNEPTTTLDEMKQTIEQVDEDNTKEGEKNEEVKDGKLTTEPIKDENEIIESPEAITEQNNVENTEAKDGSTYNKNYRSNSYSRRGGYKSSGRKMSYASSNSSSYYQGNNTTVKTSKVRSTLNGAAAEFEPQSYQYRAQNPYIQRNRSRDADFNAANNINSNQWTTNPSNEMMGDNNNQSNILDDKFDSLMKDDNSVTGKYWGDIVEDDNQIKSPVRNNGYQYNSNMRNAYINAPSNIPNYAVTPSYYNNTMNTYNPSIPSTMMANNNLMNTNHMSYRHGSMNSNYSRGRENSFSSTSSPSVHAAPFIPQHQRANYNSNIGYPANQDNMNSTNTNGMKNTNTRTNSTATVSFPEYQWTKINVSRLQSNITTEHIQKLFAQFGAIKSLSMKDAKVGNVVFLEYEKAEDAENAVRELDDVHPELKYPDFGIPSTTDTICVDFAYHKSAPSRNVRASVTPVRIQGLSLDTKRGEIKVACVKFGDIARTRLLKSENAHGSKCSAMVEYVYPESANTALVELAGHLNSLGYQNIKVEEWNYSKIGTYNGNVPAKGNQYHGYNNHANNNINTDNMGSGYTTLNNSPVHLESSMPSSPSSTTTLNETKEDKEDKTNGNGNKAKNTTTTKVFNRAKLNNEKINKKTTYKMASEDTNSSLDTVVNATMNTVAVSE